MLVLIGSRALQHYGRLVGRQPADWDVVSITTKGSVRVDGVRVELQSAQDPNDITNGFVYWYSRYFGDEKLVETPLGKAIAAPLELLKALKLSCVDHLEKAKHRWDLDALADVDVPDNLWPFIVQREAEIATRIVEQKKQFFDKYKIQRYIDHDELHTFIQNPPSYKKVLIDAVNVSEDCFRALTLAEQVSIIREEAMALALERELIPVCVAHPSLAQVAYVKFMRVVDSNDPAMRWLSRLSVPGKLKDHPDWIAHWAMDNNAHILSGYADWWETKLQQLPKAFWVRILTSKKDD